MANQKKLFHCWHFLDLNTVKPHFLEPNWIGYKTSRYLSIRDIMVSLKVYIVGTYKSHQHIHCFRDIGAQDTVIQLSSF